MSYKISDEKAFEFLSGLQKQFDFYSKLIQLSIDQADCVSKSDEKGLFAVLEQKQKHIDSLDALSKQYIDEKVLLEQTPMGEFSCIDQEIDEVLKAIEKALQKLIESETRDMEQLKAYQEKHHDKMDQLNRGKNIAQAYLSKGPRSRMDRQV